MKKINMIGLDLAKNIFQLHAVDELGNAIMKKKIKRENLLKTICSIKPCIVAMEACSGAHFWARQFSLAGHEVKLISPQYVKAFVKGNKNDQNDAFAICEAAMRPSMSFVPIKTIQQIDLQAIHRYRDNCVKQRTRISNEIRGHLAEHGYAFPKGICHVRNNLPQLYSAPDSKLTLEARDYLSDLYEDLLAMDVRIKKYTDKLNAFVLKDADCKRLKTIPGIGVIGATIIKAAAGDGKQFKNGRHFAAWLGLVPQQHSSGGKTQLGGISKRGDKYIRTKLIQGAHSIVNRAPEGSWLAGVKERRGHNRACVAQANKNARTAWAILTSQEEYKENHKPV